ncbi:hypothetical protein [Stomatobaculum longum]|uniref:hypothetical protein n=1 Tax=Stomatobaculum longum TaxID=796942 RepID=UPI0028D19BFF|nr:hypothetical protein [Stomatobaculum longum]
MMYENLRKAVRAEYEKRISKNSDRILAVDSRNGATTEALRAAAVWATKHTITQYNNGEIGVDTYVIRAEKRMRATLEKIQSAVLEKIRVAETAEKPEHILLWVDWKESRTWGKNPHVELIVGNKVYRGTATGCGYDKESAAIAEALNAYPGTLKILYDVKEAALAGDESISNENAIGYGAGYGALPYYEPGVGVNSLVAILEKCGYNARWFYSPGRSFFEIEKRRG